MFLCAKMRFRKNHRHRKKGNNRLRIAGSADSRKTNAKKVSEKVHVQIGEPETRNKGRIITQLQTPEWFLFKI